MSDTPEELEAWFARVEDVLADWEVSDDSARWTADGDDNETDSWSEDQLIAISQAALRAAESCDRMAVNVAAFAEQVRRVQEARRSFGSVATPEETR